MTLRKSKGPTPAWWTLLNEAVRIIDEERQVVMDSYSDSAGKVTDAVAKQWIRRYERWLKAARIELVKRHEV